MTSIRQARVDDVETLQNLNNEVFLDNKKYDDDIIEDWAKQQGYKRMYVNSYFKNVRAIKFYKKSDFKEIDLSLETKI